jgi:hypothetical protein
MDSRDPSSEHPVDGGSPQTPVALSTHVIIKKKRPERSCILCHRRKIRCDKKSPCASCARTGVLCCYPGPEPPTRRPHKSTIADVSARLAQLERTILAINNHSSPNTSGDDTAPDPRSTARVSMRGSKTGQSNEEVLVQNGYSSTYFNEVLFSRVLEEVGNSPSAWYSIFTLMKEQEIQSVLATPRDENHGEYIPSFNLGGILSSLNPHTDIQKLHPPKWQAMQLWQAFVNNVDPLIKILHIPTAQITIFKAINNPGEASDEVNALLFSIYFAGTTSLLSDDVFNLLRQDKFTALSTFKQGLELSLAQANLLDNPTIILLQALTLFLVSTSSPNSHYSNLYHQRCVRAYNASRSVWILNGLAIRSAQSIGLHRDGKNFKLSPFDAEMRRRLWWQIWGPDSRAAEDHGIMVTTFDAAADITFPLNLDDSELYPEMTELPAVTPKFSQMTYMLIAIELGTALRQLYRMVLSSDILPSETTRKETVAKVKAHIEGYLQHCNPNIPAQRAALRCARLMLRKLDFVSSQQWLNRSDPEGREGRATEGNLINACEILELNLEIQFDDLLRGFLWSFATYPQYHLLLYVLWHLCVKPVGPNVVRAWAAVNSTFDYEDSTSRNNVYGRGSKRPILNLLRDKALRIGNSINPNGDQNRVEEASNLNREVPNNGFEGPSDPAFTDGMNWDTDPASFPDWNSLVDDFNFQQCEF